jgi:hypothetical protein
MGLSSQLCKKNICQIIIGSAIRHLRLWEIIAGTGMLNVNFAPHEIIFPIAPRILTQSWVLHYLNSFDAYFRNGIGEQSRWGGNRANELIKNFFNSYLIFFKNDTDLTIVIFQVIYMTIEMFLKK